MEYNWKCAFCGQKTNHPEFCDFRCAVNYYKAAFRKAKDFIQTYRITK